MGQVCSGDKDESKKPTAFGSVDDDDDIQNDPYLLAKNHSDRPKIQPATQVIDNTQQQPPEDAEVIKKAREEQARLDHIVQTAGRGMVAVRSTRGTTGYYDQGFGAALSQHLEQTVQFSDQLPVRLPPASSESVYARLSQPQWDGIQLDTRDGLAGLAGKDPLVHFDQVAEDLLDKSVVKKERLLSGVAPMVENLL